MDEEEGWGIKRKGGDKEEGWKKEKGRRIKMQGEG